MGLLDDAIREHLELKRRGGADAGEVERLEQEALGPARREPLSPEEPGAETDFEAEPDPTAAEPDSYVPTPEDEEVQSLAEDEEPFYDDDLLGEDDDAEEEPEPAEPEGQSITDQPTVQFDVAQLHEHEDAGIAGPGADAPHDELEDTPEFLQETPEHDRLWFEQKPPRDFDF
jgi:hypothetical protein